MISLKRLEFCSEFILDENHVGFESVIHPKQLIKKSKQLKLILLVAGSFSFLGITMDHACTTRITDCLGLYGQVTKCTRWMPRQSEAMKDVEVCDKRR